MAGEMFVDSPGGRQALGAEKFINLYRISSGGQFDVKAVPFNSPTISVNYEKYLFDGYMTEPAFLRLQEFTGNALRANQGVAVPIGRMAELAARSPDLPQVGSDGKITGPLKKKRGRPAKAANNA